MSEEERQAQGPSPEASPSPAEREHLEERLALLILVESNEAALKLIVTWPNVRTKGDVTKNKPALIEKWARLAGVRPREVQELWPLLFDNGFLDRKTGRVEDVTLRYARRVLAKRSGLSR